MSAYQRGSVVNPQDLADDQITMTVDQANAFAFKIDDIEERHSHVNFEALATSSGAFALKKIRCQHTTRLCQTVQVLQVLTMQVYQVD